MTDDKNSVRLTRRRVLGGLVGIGVAGTATGAGTMALFSDSETSSGNTVQAGTLDLKLSGSGDQPASNSGSFDIANIAPEETKTRSLRLENAGSIDADHLELTFDTTEIEGGVNNEADTAPNTAGGFATMLEIDLTYGGSDTDITPSGHNGNGVVDLADLRTSGVLQVPDAPGSGGGAETLDLEVTFVSDTSASYTGSLNDDDFQGDELDLTVNAALAQESGQQVLTDPGDTPVRSGLVAHYPFDGNAHDVEDGHDGVPQGNVTFQSGKIGQAAHFDGTNDAIKVSNLPDSELHHGLSICAWIRTADASETGQRIFADDDSNTTGYAFSLGDGGEGKLRFYDRAKDQIILDTSNLINANTWYHVAAVYDDDMKTRSIYVNADRKAHLTNDTGPWGTDAGSAAAGGETNASPESGYKFHGDIDDLRVYKRPLSETELGTIYDLGS